MDQRDDLLIKSAVAQAMKPQQRQPEPDGFPLPAILQMCSLGILSPRQVYNLLFDGNVVGGFRFDGFDYASHMGRIHDEGLVAPPRKKNPNGIDLDKSDVHRIDKNAPC